MKPYIFNDKITENNYKEFVEQIINFFRLSNYDKSILFSLRLEKDDCIMKLSILRQDGTNQEYEDVHANCNDHFFYDFLEYMISAFRENCEIEKEDIVNLDDDHYVAFRMITQYNDLITIDGLTESQANRFLKENNSIQDVNIDNHEGSSSILGIILMIITLIISIVAVVFLVD